MAWQKKWLSDDEKSGDAKKAHARAVWYLSQRDHAAEELYEKLCRYFTEEASAAAVADMVNYNYIDDERYARNKATSLLLAHKSRREITQKLTQKGVDRALVASVLDALYAKLREDDADGNDPDTQAAFVLITRRYAKKLAQGRKDLVVAALTRRGFSYAIIRDALALAACETGQE